MTGRGLGFCAGLAVPALINLAFGRGRGGRGGGRGWRNMFYATGLTGWQRAAMAAQSNIFGAGSETTKDQEINALKQQAPYAADMLENIRKRISELEGSSQAVQ
jgi:hypothetical protein